MVREPNKRPNLLQATVIYMWHKATILHPYSQHHLEYKFSNALTTCKSILMKPVLKGTNTLCSNKFKFASLILTFDPMKHSYCRSKGKIYCAEMMQSANTKSDLDLLTLAKSIWVLVGSQAIHASSIIIVQQQITELLCGNGAKFKVRIWPWPLTYWPKKQ